MTNDIPAIYWMVLIAVLSGFFAFIMYQIAMLLSGMRKTIDEVTITVKKSNSMLDDVKLVVGSAKNIVATVEGTVNQVNELVITPVKNIAGVLGIASSFVAGMKGKDSDQE